MLFSTIGAFVSNRVPLGNHVLESFHYSYIQATFNHWAFIFTPIIFLEMRTHELERELLKERSRLKKKNLLKRGKKNYVQKKKSCFQKNWASLSLKDM